jgi:hypothetical protein
MLATTYSVSMNDMLLPLPLLLRAPDVSASVAPCCHAAQHCLLLLPPLLLPLLLQHRMSSSDLADMLHRIRRALIARGVADTADPSNQPMVINARVPLVMFADAASGVAVDISVCNHCGAFKSK